MGTKNNFYLGVFFFYDFPLVRSKELNFRIGESVSSKQLNTLSFLRNESLLRVIIAGYLSYSNVDGLLGYILLRATSYECIVKRLRTRDVCSHSRRLSLPVSFRIQLLDHYGFLFIIFISHAHSVWISRSILNLARWPSCKWVRIHH